MELIKELKDQTIVILARSFNPSIFNRHWLIKNGFVEEDEVLPNSIFTPGVTQLFTKNYNLLVLPEQLQFSFNGPEDMFERDLTRSLIPIIKKLQEIPYTAVGVNFKWFISDSTKDIIELSKILFFSSESKLHQKLISDNSRFGTYISTNFDGARLKLDVKPITVTSNGQLTDAKNEYINFSFNFHLDLNIEDCADELINTLNKWKEFKKESVRIIDLL